MTRFCGCVPPFTALVSFAVLAFTRAALYAFAAARYPEVDSVLARVLLGVLAAGEIAQCIVMALAIQNRKPFTGAIALRVVLMGLWVALFVVIYVGAIPVRLRSAAASVTEVYWSWVLGCLSFAITRVVDVYELIVLVRYTAPNSRTRSAILRQ